MIYFIGFMLLVIALQINRLEQYLRAIAKNQVKQYEQAEKHHKNNS